MEPIQIRMLGTFSLQFGTNCISDTGSRTRKQWNLLAYMICNRGYIIPQQKLIDLMWGDDAASSNPENALRITFHRLRTLLDQLWDGAGRDLILRKEGGYCWNEAVPVTLDCATFEDLCLDPAADDSHRLDHLLQALTLYQGPFLPRHASEMWAVPVATHYQNLFLQSTMEAAGLLSARQRHAEAVEICRNAAASEPYHEPLYQILMQELSAAGDPKGAATVYETLSHRLFDDFGIRPSEETRAIYRAAAHSPGDRELPMDEILLHLQEPEGNYGAMECDYDYFKVLCYAESRAMERSGNAAHVALLSLNINTEKPLTKRSQDRIMEQLGQTLRFNLRRGDIISRCSATQYIFMLPQANYENSCMVCRRVLAAFHRTYPHVAAQFRFMVQPLTPSIRVP